MISALLLPACRPAVKPPPADSVPPVLRRAYAEGETLRYRLTLQYSLSGEEEYSADSTAAAAVRKRSDGVYYETWQWLDRRRDGAEVKLPAENAELRQLLSLDPGFNLVLPDLSRVPPLAEPAVDALSFYSVVQLAAARGLALRPGERIFVPNGASASWAGGQVPVGRNCADLDYVVEAVDVASNTATLKVAHLPPSSGCGAVPAGWLAGGAGDTANNWYQVKKKGKSIHVASAAREISEDLITLSLLDGRIISASRQNRVAGELRTCVDERLTDCGAAGRFLLKRGLTLVQETR